ncbi:MAG: S1 RNA-binding domain-containing protein [Eubacteriales bacterium]
MNQMILPEGRLIQTVENTRYCATLQGLEQAQSEGVILEGMALHCQDQVGISVSLGGFQGFVPWNEGALGLAQGEVREIAVLCRIGRPISVIVTDIIIEEEDITVILSRGLAQKRAKDQLMSLPAGTVLPATVTRLEPFGAFVDVGCGVPSLLSIDRISVSRIGHPSQRFHEGDEIYVAILEHDWASDRIRVTHRELLGTWEENASKFSVGMTIPGIVRSIKNYGIFVELLPNFSGLAEYQEGLEEDEMVSVYIKGIVPERMKCKLLIIGSLPQATPSEVTYLLPPQGRFYRWKYSPDGCLKRSSETEFSTEWRNPTPPLFE